MDGVPFDLSTIFLVTYAVCRRRCHVALLICMLDATNATHTTSASFLFPASVARLIVASLVALESLLRL